MRHSLLLFELLAELVNMLAFLAHELHVDVGADRTSMLWEQLACGQYALGCEFFGLKTSVR